MYNTNKKLLWYFSGLLLILTSIFFIAMTKSNQAEDLSGKAVAKMVLKANTPVGKARGIFPGRVVWVFDPKVAKWDGKNGFWWEDSNTSQEEAVKMLSNSITSLTGQTEEAKAWDMIFRHFNKTKKNLDQGYKAGQKIAVKVNVNNTYSHSDCEELNASPQLVYALISSLVEQGGVPQKDITVFDASRFITDNIFNKCHRDFPDVAFVDNTGGDGRQKVTFVEDAIPYSVDNGKLAKGIATCCVEADYLINLALLKGHVGQGVTLCAKNFYGVTNINKDWHFNAHNNFNQEKDGRARYMTFVDFLGHKDLGEKTMLFLIDGIYGSRAVNGVPQPKWQMSPFDNNWACSLFASQDGVAIDAVGLDFLTSEWPDMPDVPYSDSYLVEAAQADNPPSKAFYDPERDGTKCQSLGVMEHWNNPKDKQYSRNLGKDYGIELFYKEIK